MNSKFLKIYKLTSFFVMLAMFSPLFAVAVNAQQMSAKRNALTEDQKIMHVLNRLGFGARPGDVEMVKRIGVKKYIEMQLNPDSINDSAAQAKAANLEILKMPTEEIFAKYPNGGALRKMLEGKGKKINRNAAPDNQMINEKSEQEQQAEKRANRQQLKEIYQKYNLRPANQIVRDLSASRVLRAVYSERQLQEQMVDFWTNHFNVYERKGAVKWFLPQYDRDVIRPNALGNFRDLLVATAQSPAMLFYLDNFQSVAPDAQMNGKNQNTGRQQQLILKGQSLPQRMREKLKEKFNVNDEQLDARLKQMRERAKNPKQKRGINENYARELMELHTLGVDNGYTQKDIVEVARAFTGWTIFDPRGYRNAAGDMMKGTENKRANRQIKQMGFSSDTESGEFVFNERLHDKGEKKIFGQKINEGGIGDGLKVIDILVKSPQTAKFIARKLAVKFVSDNPSEALVNHVADAFHKSNGDIKTTLHALFTDEEFFAPENYQAKIKTPFELVVSSLRALDADTNANPALLGLLAKMGEPLYGYQAPTGYPDTAADWVNTGALLERINFAVAVASNRIRGTKVDLSEFQAADKKVILDKAIKDILHGEISPNTKAALLKQIEQPLIEPKAADEEDEFDDVENASMEAMPNQRRNRQNGQARLMNPSGDPQVFKVVGLLLGSPDFQRQ